MPRTTRPRRGQDRFPPGAAHYEPAARSGQPTNGHMARPAVGVIPGGRTARTDPNGQPLGPPLERQLKGPSRHWLVDDGRDGAKPQEKRPC